LDVPPFVMVTLEFSVLHVLVTFLIPFTELVNLTSQDSVVAVAFTETLSLDTVTDCGNVWPVASTATPFGCSVIESYNSAFGAVVSQVALLYSWNRTLPFISPAPLAVRFTVASSCKTYFWAVVIVGCSEMITLASSPQAELTGPDVFGESPL
jgi:hypothetical protein